MTPFRSALPSALAAAMLAHAAGAAEPATPLSSVTVVASRTPPVLVGAWPAQDSTVAPGLAVLKLTFDQRMAEQDWRLGAGEGADKPRCLTTPRLLTDAKTFVLLCLTEPGKSYAVSLRHAPDAALAQEAAPAAVLRFKTSSDEPVRALDDAMKAAGLRPEDSPLMDLGDKPAP